MNQDFQDRLARLNAQNPRPVPTPASDTPEVAQTQAKPRVKLWVKIAVGLAATSFIPALIGIGAMMYVFSMQNDFLESSGQARVTPETIKTLLDPQTITDSLTQSSIALKLATKP